MKQPGLFPNYTAYPLVHPLFYKDTRAIPAYPPAIIKDSITRKEPTLEVVWENENKTKVYISFYHHLPPHVIDVIFE